MKKISKPSFPALNYLNTVFPQYLRKIEEIQKETSIRTTSKRSNLFLKILSARKISIPNPFGKLLFHFKVCEAD